MPRIRVNPDVLSQKADEIDQVTGEFIRAGNDLLSEVIRDISGSPSADLRASARSDALAAQDFIDQFHRDLSGKSEKLSVLSRAFQSIDAETIRLLNGMMDESRLAPTFFGWQRYPDIEGFEPYDLPQTAMAISNWAVMCDKDLKTFLHTYRTGELVGNIIGSWTDPKKDKKYYVVDLGNGQYGYIPADRISAPIDLSNIPAREGVFSNGQQDPCQDIPAPLGAVRWMPGWHRAGDPWQNLMLGFMHILGIHNAIFGTTAHANLCGELCVMYSVGETDIEAGLSIFAQLKGLGYWDEEGEKIEYTGTQVLQNPNHATSAFDLTRFFKAYGWTSGSSAGVLPTPEEITNQLLSGHQYIFLTELDTRKIIPSKETGNLTANPTYGQVVSGAPPGMAGRAAHWVAVTGVFQDRNGQIIVDIFNPFSGRKETYSWDTFIHTCQQPGNSKGSFVYIKAWK
jgi:hypothetical protein